MESEEVESMSGSEKEPLPAMTLAKDGLLDIPNGHNKCTCTYQHVYCIRLIVWEVISFGDFYNKLQLTNFVSAACTEWDKRSDLF